MEQKIKSLEVDRVDFNTRRKKVLAQVAGQVLELVVKYQKPEEMELSINQRIRQVKHMKVRVKLVASNTNKNKVLAVDLKTIRIRNHTKSMVKIMQSRVKTTRKLMSRIKEDIKIKITEEVECKMLKVSFHINKICNKWTNQSCKSF